MKPKAMPRGRPFPKGVSGNPAGYSSLPREIKEERRRNQAGLIRLVTTYSNLSHEQAMQRLQGPDCTQIEEMVQGLVNRAKEGDVNAFKFLMETMVGKIPEHNEDDFSEEDLRILRRVKEIREETGQKEQPNQ